MHLLNAYLAEGEQGDTGFQISNVVSPKDTLATNSASRLCLPLNSASRLCLPLYWRKAQLINIAKNTDLDKFLNKTNFSLFHSQIQELNLQVAYQNDIAINKFLRKIMSILFLPYHEITK